MKFLDALREFCECVQKCLRGCNWPPAIWRGFASSIRTWQYRSANSTRLRRPADRESNLRAALPARGAYPSPLRRGHSPTTRLRSRNVIRTGKRHPLVERVVASKRNPGQHGSDRAKTFHGDISARIHKIREGRRGISHKMGRDEASRRPVIKCRRSGRSSIILSRAATSF